MLTYNFTKTSGYKSFNEKSTLITLDTDTITGVLAVLHIHCGFQKRDFFATTCIWIHRQYDGQTDRNDKDFFNPTLGIINSVSR